MPICSNIVEASDTEGYFGSSHRNTELVLLLCFTSHGWMCVACIQDSPLLTSVGKSAGSWGILVESGRHASCSA